MDSNVDQLLTEGVASLENIIELNFLFFFNNAAEKQTNKHQLDS